MKHLISTAIILMLGIGVASSQSPFENWSTLNVKGNLSSKLTIAIEGEERYNYPNNQVRYFHTDVGLVYKFTEKLSHKNQVGHLNELYAVYAEKINKIQNSNYWAWGSNWDSVEIRLNILMRILLANGVLPLPKDDLIKIISELEEDDE